MTAFNPVTKFKERVLSGVINLNTDTIRVALTNTAPSVEQEDFTPGSLHPPPSNDNGYPSGGGTIANSGLSVDGEVIMFDGDNVTFTASGGTLGPFRYIVLYDETHANDALIGWYDRGASVTLNDGDELIVIWNADGIMRL